jgi:hypothetical protein
LVRSNARAIESDRARRGEMGFAGDYAAGYHDLGINGRGRFLAHHQAGFVSGGDATQSGEDDAK